MVGVIWVSSSFSLMKKFSLALNFSIKVIRDSLDLFHLSPPLFFYFPNVKSFGNLTNDLIAIQTTYLQRSIKYQFVLLLKVSIGYTRTTWIPRFRIKTSECNYYVFQLNCLWKSRRLSYYFPHPRIPWTLQIIHNF